MEDTSDDNKPVTQQRYHIAKNGKTYKGISVASRKAKGRNAENRWADKWKQVDPDAHRQERSGAGYMKGDINTKEPICFEVKFYAEGFTYAKKALEQASKASQHEMSVCVAYTTYNETEEPVIFMWGDDFRSLYQAAKNNAMAAQAKQQIWAVRALIAACKKFLKEFGEL